MLGFSARSLVLAYRFGDGDQINALIYPQAIYRVLDGFAVAAIDIGLVLHGERLLAARQGGNYREFDASSRVDALFPRDGYLRTIRQIPGFPLPVVADLPAALKYKHLVPQFTLYLCGAIFAAVGGIWLIRRLFKRIDSLPFQLQNALAQRQLTLHYQPVVDMDSRRCLGIEALLRWDHPTYGLLSPDTFVPLAERTSVIVPITEWILEAVIRQLEGVLAQWTDLYVSINLCHAHLLSKAFADGAIRRIGESRIQPHQVHFELTERTLSADDEVAAATVARFRHAGFRIAVDDFGTGYSTLNSLRAIRVDYLKIDRAFVEAIGTCAVTEHLVDSILDMAKKLELEVVAEGVERAEQARYLLEKGVRMGQGFLFGKPAPLDGLLADIANTRQPVEGARLSPASELG